MSDETMSETLEQFAEPRTIKDAAENLGVSKEIVARRVKELVAGGKLFDAGPEVRVGVKGVRPRQYART